MIRLTKTNPPQILVDQGREWTQTLMENIANGTVTDAQRLRYRDPAIKEALKHETSGKCAYCESKILHIAFGDIEHIWPKSVSPELTFEWTNLTLACSVCNVNKSNNFPRGMNLVNPYTCDPNERFLFLGPLVMAKTGDGGAICTERFLKLNRTELVLERIKRINALRDYVEAMESATPEVKEMLLALLPDEVASHTEYSGAAVAALAVMRSNA